MMNKDTSMLEGVYVVYYDSTIYFAGSEKEAIRFQEQKQMEWPCLHWACTTVEDYGQNLYEQGVDEGEQNMSEE